MEMKNAFGLYEEKELRGIIEELPVLGCAKNFAKYLDTDTKTVESQLEKQLITKLRNNIDNIYVNYVMDRTYSKMSPEELLKEVRTLYMSQYPIENEETSYILECIEDCNDSEIHGYIKQVMSDTLDKIIEEATATERDKTIKSLKQQLKNNTDYIVNSTDAIAKRRKENMEIGKRLKEEFGIEV